MVSCCFRVDLPSIPCCVKGTSIPVRFSHSLKLFVWKAKLCLCEDGVNPPAICQNGGEGKWVSHPSKSPHEVQGCRPVHAGVEEAEFSLAASFQEMKQKEYAATPHCPLPSPQKSSAYLSYAFLLLSYSPLTGMTPSWGWRPAACSLQQGSVYHSPATCVQYSCADLAVQTSSVQKELFTGSGSGLKCELFL